MAKSKFFSSWLLFLAIFALLLSGCVTKPEVVRYQVVEITDYRTEDYEKLLDSENAEVQYNAISNLIKDARNYAGILERGIKPEEESSTKVVDKYNNAYNVYRTIASKTNSENEDVQVASLIFSAELGRHIGKGRVREELFERILQIDARNRRTQYEQLNALVQLRSGDDQEVNQNIINKGLGSKSWMVRSMTYRLLSKSQSEAYNQKLIDRYRNAKEEHDKFLIISALHAPYEGEVSGFLREELKSNAGAKLKQYLAKAITRSQDSAAVARWLVEEYPSLDKNNSVVIVNAFSSYLPKFGSIKFFKSILATDDRQAIQLLDSEYVFWRLFDALSSHEDIEDLQMLEKLFLENEQLRSAFQNYKIQATREKYLEEESQRAIKETVRTYIPKLITVSEEILMDINLLLEKKGFNRDEIDMYSKEYREYVDNTIRSLKEEDEAEVD